MRAKQHVAKTMKSMRDVREQNQGYNHLQSEGNFMQKRNKKIL